MENNNYEYSYDQNAQNSANTQYQYQYQYQQPQQQYYGNDNSAMSLGEWLITIIVGSIPCVGIILYLVWAFSSTVNVNKRNYCRAVLIVGVVVSVLSAILGAVIGATVAETFSNMYY